MNVLAGATPAHPSTTARPADKGANTEPDPAVLRRCIDALVTMGGIRRKTAREMIRARIAGGAAIDDLEAWLRASHRIDPTGVEAVHKVMRGRSC